MKYWVHVISKDHALTGVEAGFIWAKPADLQLLRRYCQVDEKLVDRPPRY